MLSPNNTWFFRVQLLAIGAVIGLGQAPFGLWPATILGFAAALIIAVKTVTLRQAFGVGWWTGTGYFLLSFRWIIEPFLVDAEQYGWMAPFALLFMAAGFALFWGFAFAAALRLKFTTIWTFTAALALGEMARSFMLTGFPWALPGHIWIDTPIAQMAAIVGPHGLSLFTLVLAASIAEMFRRKFIFAIVPVCAAIIWVMPTAPEPALTEDRPLVRIAQPNVPQEEKWDPIRKAVHFERLLDITRTEVEKLDLIVWPETAVAQLIEFAQPALDEISDTVAGTPLITGIQRRAGDDIYHNSLVFVGRGGAIDAIYDKEHLVPFGEYFPGGELASRLGLVGFASSQGAGFTVGSTPHTFEIPGVGLARPLICYEGIFAEEISSDGARPSLLILITNDAWFGKSAGPQQHLVQARFRAIEQGLPMVRAANTGISAMISPKGQLIQTLALDQSGYIDAFLPKALPKTLYARFGDLPNLGLTILLLIASVLKRSRITD